MKRTITLLALSLIGFTSFSQDTTKKAHPQKEKLDSVAVFNFTVTDIYAVLPDIKNKIYLKGWNNTSLEDVFNDFIIFLQNRKQFTLTAGKAK